MTTKKEKLVQALGNLVSTYSQEDWLYVAEQFEAIASLSRNLASIATDKPKKKVQRKVGAKTQQKKRYVASDPLVSQLAKVLADPKLGTNVSVLKNIAIAIGIKADLPKLRVDLEDMILKSLDESPDRARQSKLQTAVSFIENREKDQSADYQRWVSLITNSNE